MAKSGSRFAPLPRPNAAPSPERSDTMRAVRSGDTGPELRLRRALFARGLRYRLRDRRLPGSPDLVFAGRRAVIFVHGCFWHGHDCRRGARLPKTNAAYWAAKIARNRARDAAAAEALARMGWRALVIWECDIDADTGAAADACQSWLTEI